MVKRYSEKISRCVGGGGDFTTITVHNSQVPPTSSVAAVIFRMI